jgi:hypothetical protein
MVEVAEWKRRSTRTPINELLEYWIDISKRPTLTVNDLELFFQKATATFDHFAHFYGWYRPKHAEMSSDKFLRQIHSMVWWKKEHLKRAMERKHLTNNEYALMKDVAKKFIPRIRKCFGLDLVVATSKKSPLQDAEALLGSSTKLTYRWAAGIIASNYIAMILIQLCRFQTGEKYKDDIDALSAKLKNRTRNPKLRTFLVKSYRRFEDADKIRNRCAHVLEGEPTKQEIEQSISLARLLQKYLPRS